MATTEQRATLQELAKRHLWLHFSRMGAYSDGAEIPIIVRGEGCHVWDEHGHRFFDGLSALFCVNIGHGRADVAAGRRRAGRGARLLHELVLRAPARRSSSPRAIADLAPGDLNRVFFTSGGSEAVETAIKLARQYHKLTGNPNKTKVIARDIAYHGTTLGALTATGITGLRAPFEPFTPGGCHVPNTNQYRLKPGYGPEMLADAVAERIEFEGPETVAAVIMEPVQNAGGCFTPPDGLLPAHPRDLRPLRRPDGLRRGHLLLGPPRRPGSAPQRYDYQPDIITTAKGITSRLRADGRGDLVGQGRRAVPRGPRDVHARPHVRRPPDGLRGRAGQHRRDGARGRASRTSASTRARSAGCSTRCATSRSSATCAARATSTRSSSSRTGHEGAFDDDESEWLLREFLSGALYDAGLICRADDRGDPVIQLSPPLIAGPEHFEEIEGMLRPVLEEASRRIRASATGAMLTVRELLLGPRRRGPRRRGRARRAGPLGAHLRAGRPDAVAVGRRAAADDGPAAHRRARPARVRRAPRRPRPRRPRLRPRVRARRCPPALVEAAAARGFPLL